MRSRHRRFPLLVLALGVTPSWSHAQAGFEGIATFVMRDKAGGRVDTMVQSVKGRAIRMDGTNKKGRGGGGMIIDGEKKRMVMIDDDSRTAMVMTQEDQAKMKAMTAGMMAGRPTAAPRPSANADDAPTIVKTGRSETVAGVRCDVWHGSSRKQSKLREGDVCIADGVGFALFSEMADNPMFQNATSESKRWTDFRKMVGEGKGLIKATSTEDGNTYVALELVKLEKKSIPSSAFEPPAGYKVQDMSEMMQKASGAMEQLKKMRKDPPPR